ncbi:MAG: sulfite exporter TauE/SafE family protein [Nitrososphaerales archaeon]
MIEQFLIFLVALLAGFLLGMVGFGWGSILVPTLILLNVEPTIAIGSVLLTNVILSFVGSLNHLHKGNPDSNIILPLILGGTIGSIGGAAFSLNIGSALLSLFLSSYLIIGGIIVVFGISKFNINGIKHKVDEKRFSRFITAGSIPGFFEGAYGSGGPAGIITLLLLKVPVHRAVGSWLPTTIVLQLIPTILYLLNFKVDLQLTFSLLAGGLPAIFLGINFSGKVSPRILRTVISFIVISLGVRLLIGAIL